MYIHERDEYRDFVDHKLITFLLKCNLYPILVPNIIYNSLNTNEKNSIIHIVSLIFRAIFSGGSDDLSIGHRANTEKLLSAFCEKNGHPLVGICRGMQYLAIKAGSKLKRVEGHVGTEHTLNGHFNHLVNSFHDYSLDNIPENFEILATSNDENIEAMVNYEKKQYGIMWHPERQVVTSVEDIKFFKDIFGVDL